MVTNPLSVLWKGRCKIWGYEDVTDPVTHRTTQNEVVVTENEPCRVSFSTAMSQSGTTEINDGIGVMVQVTTLFIRPDLEISAGSIIEVTQNGVTTKYMRSGKPRVHTNHQELSLTLYEDTV